MNLWLKPWQWWPLRVDLETYETEQPWVIYRYLSTDHRSRITGRSVIDCECAICGEVERLRMPIPRFGEIEDRGKHPERIRFLLGHVHGDRPPQMTWKRPLLNPFASGPLDLAALSMRLQADLLEAGH